MQSRRSNPGESMSQAGLKRNRGVRAPQNLRHLSAMRERREAQAASEQQARWCDAAEHHERELWERGPERAAVACDHSWSWDWRTPRRELKRAVKQSNP